MSSPKRYGIAPVIQWQASDATKITFEADIYEINIHLIAKHVMQARSLLIVHPKPICGKQVKQNRLYNDNNMTQLRVEHDLE